MSETVVMLAFDRYWAELRSNYTGWVDPVTEQQVRSIALVSFKAGMLYQAGFASTSKRS